MSLAARPRASIGIATVLLGLWACSRRDTGLVIDVTTDCVIPADIDELLIRVSTSAGKRLPDTTLALKPEQSLGRLGRLGLAPEGDPPPTSLITLEAVGLRAHQEVVSQRAVDSFVAGEVVVVPLVLKKGCIGSPCAAMGKTCVVKDEVPGCVDPAVVADAGAAGNDGANDSGPRAGGAGTGGGSAGSGGGAAGTSGEPGGGGSGGGGSSARGAQGTGGGAGNGAGGGAGSAPDAASSPDAPGTGGAVGGPDAATPPPPDAAPDQPTQPPVLGLPGTACTIGSACLSGVCVDEVCCERGCTDRCYACRTDLTGAPSGQCAATLAGRDPRDQCAEAPVASCGNDGQCDGQGGCRLRAAGVMCVAASCASNSYVGPAICDGAGACQTPAPQSCGLFACSDRGCPNSCQQDDQCASGAYCDASVCKEKKDRLAPCLAGRECKTGQCLDLLGLGGLVCT